jgi:hypothetical protein
MLMDAFARHAPATMQWLRRRSFLTAALASLAMASQSSVTAKEDHDGESRAHDEAARSSLASLAGYFGTQDGQVVTVSGYYAPDDEGGGRFRWDAMTPRRLHDGGSIISPSVPFGATAAGHVGYLHARGETAQAAAGCWIRITEGHDVFPAWFGTVGDGDESTHPVTAYGAGSTSGVNWLYKITEQTRDGNALNAAIRCARARRLDLALPAGHFAVHAYLEPIDWSCTFRGAGSARTTLANCAASPTNAGGYGIVTFIKTLDDTGKAVAQVANAITVNVSDLTLDGNAQRRAKPTGELQCYPIAFYGYIAKGSRVERVVSRNSPIDCFMTSYAAGEYGGLDVVSCEFRDAFRNTVSNVSGDYQAYRQCIISGGGQIQGGTNPKYCLDIEPNRSDATISNISYEECLFEDAVNGIIGGVWASARFTDCTTNAFNRKDPAGMANQPAHTPWATCVRFGEFTFSNCRFQGDGSRQNEVRADTSGRMGAFANRSVVRFRGCRFDGIGMYFGEKQHLIIEDCTARNSKRNWRLDGNNDPQSKVTVKGLRLLNVLECAPSDGRAPSSFYCLRYRGQVDVDGVTCIFDPALLPTGDAKTFASKAAKAYAFLLPIGTYLSTGARTGEVIVMNCSAEGYTERFPEFFGRAPNASNYGEWHSSSGVSPLDRHSTAPESSNAR